MPSEADVIRSLTFLSDRDALKRLGLIVAERVCPLPDSLIESLHRFQSAGYELLLDIHKDNFYRKNH